MALSSSNPLDIVDMSPLLVAEHAAEQIARATNVDRHDVAIVLGSGWEGTTEDIGEVVADLLADDIEGFSAPAVAGHSGRIQSIRLPDGKHVLAIGARTHLYEGHGVRRVVHSVRTAAATGAKTLILTNGSGGVDASLPPGTPVLISDHINLTAESPLEGPTFVDLTDLYSQRLRDLARRAIPSIQEGIYVQFRGPHFETPAEVQMIKSFGARTVGMSTALEAIAAREAGIEVLGISLVTVPAAGIGADPLGHADVLDVGDSAKPALKQLLSKLFSEITEA